MLTKNAAVYFDSFGIECISQEALNRIKGKSTTHNIFRIQSREPVMCGFSRIAFLEYLITRKTLLDYTNLFSPNDHQKNSKIIYKYFRDQLGQRKHDDRLKNRLDCGNNRLNKKLSLSSTIT